MEASYEQPYVNNKRLIVTGLLDRMEKLTMRNSTRSVTLEPKHLQYYSPEKQTIVEQEKLKRHWRYYPNSREPVALLHQQQFQHTKFINQREREKAATTLRTLSRQSHLRSQASDVPPQQKHVSKKIRENIKKLQKLHLDMKYTPYKFGQIPLDQQLEKFSYWDPNKRNKLKIQFCNSLPQSPSGGGTFDRMVALKMYHQGHK